MTNQLNNKYTLFEWAQKYWRLGWNVIPLFNYQKNPASASHLLPKGGWLELQKRRVTEEELDLWFKKNKPTGIGVITGKISDIVVVDEDSYKQGGLKIDFQSPMITQTASGGKHYFFKYKENIKTIGYRQNINIEVKSDGGFVVLPPSKVINKFGATAEYQWLKATTNPLPTIDEAIINEFKTKYQNYYSLHDLVGVGEGQRHNNLRTIALKTFSRFKKEDWDLAGNYIRFEAKRMNPPLPEKEVERLIKDCANFILTHSKTEIEKTIATTGKLIVLSPEETKKLYEEKVTKYKDGLSTGYSSLDEYFKFLPEQLYLLSASTHIGKTTFALNIAGKIALSGKRVLFASLEQGVFILPRLRSIFQKDIIDNFSTITSDEFPTADDFIYTIQDLREKPDILFLDHLHYFARGEKKANEEIDRIIVEIQVMAKKLQLPIFVIAHVRKLISDNKIPTLDDIKDSVSLSQIPSVIMIMHREKKDLDLVLENEGIYSNKGKIVIYKNRIQGKTGVLEFSIDNYGKIELNS